MKSIAAYDVADRVARYDVDMDLMHPNRMKMVAVVVEFLPPPDRQALRILDLGCGTGYFAKCLADRFPNASFLCVDSSPIMLDLAGERLRGQQDRVDYLSLDFTKLGERRDTLGKFDVIVSSFAFHHLDREAKAALVSICRDLLTEGGWFLNADIIISGHEAIEARYQELRADGIVERAGGRDPRFESREKTQNFIHDLEVKEGDQPATLDSDLSVYRGAGLKNVEVLWLEYREAVICGQK